VRNPATGESRGFGFVGMSEEDEVDAVRSACPLNQRIRRHMHSCVPFGCVHILLTTRYEKASHHCGFAAVLPAL